MRDKRTNETRAVGTWRKSGINVKRNCCQEKQEVMFEKKKQQMGKDDSVGKVGRKFYPKQEVFDEDCRCKKDFGT